MGGPGGWSSWVVMVGGLNIQVGGLGGWSRCPGGWYL